MMLVRLRSDLNPLTLKMAAKWGCIIWYGLCLSGYIRGRYDRMLNHRVHFSWLLMVEG